MNTVLSTDRPSGEVSTEEMNKLIDLDRYPIDRLDNKAGQLLVARLAGVPKSQQLPPRTADNHPK